MVNFLKSVQYLRFEEKKAIQLDIYPVDVNQKNSWLKSSHLKEIEFLMKDIIINHVNTAEDKTKNLKSDIIQGSLLQIGYLFKKRLDHDLLLFSECFGEPLSDLPMNFFMLHKEKLLLYVNELSMTSPTGITKLKTAMNHNMLNNQSAISISSYFPKINAEKCLEPVEDNASACKTDHAVISPDERRNVLKKIVEHNNPVKRKRRNSKNALKEKKRTEKAVKISNLCSAEGLRENTDRNLKECLTKMEVNYEAENIFGNQSENPLSHSILPEIVNTFTVHTEEELPYLGLQQDSVVPLDKESIELLSHPVHWDMLDTLQNKENCTNDKGTNDISDGKLVSYNTRRSMYKEDFSSDEENESSNKVENEKEVEKIVARKNIPNRVTRSHIFNDGETTLAKPVRTRNSAKRVLPNLSDSCSDKDDTDPPSKKVCVDSVNLSKRIAKETKSRSLKGLKGRVNLGCNESSSLKQSTLNFSSPKLSSETEDNRKEFDPQELSSILIDSDEDDVVSNNQETDLMRVKVSNTRCLEDLTTNELNFMVRNNKTFLRNIFEGKIQSKRHEIFKKGGCVRKNLGQYVNVNKFSDAQIDAVMEALTSVFCKKNQRFLDYVMKVLLPEMLVKIHMEISGCSYEESEAFLC